MLVPDMLAVMMNHSYVQFGSFFAKVTLANQALIILFQLFPRPNHDGREKETENYKI
jgi:hypothetical protein